MKKFLKKIFGITKREAIHNYYRKKGELLEFGYRYGIYLEVLKIFNAIESGEGYIDVFYTCVNLEKEFGSVVEEGFKELVEECIKVHDNAYPSIAIKRRDNSEEVNSFRGPL